MSTRNPRIELILVSVAAAGLFLGLWLTEPTKNPPEQASPEQTPGNAERISSAKGPAVKRGESRLPVVTAVASATTAQRPVDLPTDIPALPVSTSVWPDSSYSDEEYSLSKIEVYRQFQAASKNWTVETYDAKAANVDELSGRQIYELYTYLRACHQQPRSVEALNQRVNRIRGSERMNRRMSAEGIESMVENYQSRLIRCESLPEDRALEPLMLDWLTLAASRGFPQAQIAYYRSARWLLTHDRWAVYRYPERVREYQRLAPAFLQAALQSGHHDALYEYSLALRENIIFDEDPVASYAYAVAADLASAAGNQEAQEIMALLETVLSADDIRDARLNGRELCQTHCRPGPA